MYDCEKDKKVDDGLLKQEWWSDKNNFPAYGFIIDEDYFPPELPVIIEKAEGSNEAGVNLLYCYNPITKEYDGVIAKESFRLASENEKETLYVS